MFEDIPTKNDYLNLESINEKEEYRSSKSQDELDESPDLFPTDAEVLSACKIYRHMMDEASILGNSMLSVWAVTNYQTWNSIAFNRRLL